MPVHNFAALDLLPATKLSAGMLLLNEEIRRSG